jgi:hypothetical protein
MWNRPRSSIPWCLRCSLALDSGARSRAIAQGDIQALIEREG